MSPSAFKKLVWKFYNSHGRHSLPWRNTRDPYKILVSEIMLQQTQVDRVILKYKSFLKKFSTARSLAKANTKDVLFEWQGLGYNRRAINLKRAAENITKEYSGRFPRDYKTLLSLPGIGPATAGDLLAFAWNIPGPVIETNIRTVYIHHFFSDREKVGDKELLPLIEETFDRENPREWLYALMDYGTHLKKTRGNNITKSKHYKKQSPFKGSNRELRSKILRLILEKPRTEKELLSVCPDKETLRKNLALMEKEGLIQVKKGKITP